MDKLKLTAKQKVIFQAAIQTAYDGGKTQATNAMRGLYQLVDSPEKILANVTKQYCEEGDEPEIVKEKYIREPGDGHDEFS